jgi:hypothetical protein
MATTLTPTHEFFDDRGYRFIETSMEWRLACRPLPCFAALWWPDYGTKVIEDTIDGKPVIIQLWKGWCQQFLGLKNMPGGVGGEVGVYARQAARQIAEKIPEKIPNIPSAYVMRIKEKLAGLKDDEMWWPYPDSVLKTTISFDFVNPHTDEVVFSAPQEQTYWHTRWMDLPSYHKYVESQPGTWPLNKKVPALAWDYTLRYTINGRRFPDWVGHK